jgi:hypothetical protein
MRRRMAPAARHRLAHRHNRFAPAALSAITPQHSRISRIISAVRDIRFASRAAYGRVSRTFLRDNIFAALHTARVYLPLRRLCVYSRV